MVVLHFLFFNIFLVVWRVNCPYTGEGELLLMDGRIALNGWANCPEWMGELQFAPTRMLSERWQIYI